MANELRARDGMLAGTLDVDHTSGATTLTAAILAAHRAIDSTMHSAWVISDPYDGLIARTTYNPGSTTTYSTTSTTEAAIDATNLKVVVVAPRSGKVRIRLHAVGGVSSSAASLYWCVLNGSNVRQGATQYITQAIAANSADVTVPISGLTPGTSYTFYWGHNVDGAITGNTYVGGTAPGDYVATMDVYDDSQADSPANTEIVYVTAHTASAGTATILRGQEGTTAQAWKAGSRIVHGPTIRDLALGRVQESVGNGAGDINTSSTTYVAIAGGMGAVNIPAQAGDLLEMFFMCATYSGFVNNRTDIAFAIAGSVRTDRGVQRMTSPAANYVNAMYSYRTYLVTAADVSGGAVAVQMYWKTPDSSIDLGNASTFIPTLTVKNLGPQEA